jgi:hypothetical protein
MPDTMIERMARALCEKRMTPPIYPQEVDQDWPLFADDARAVLAAMREPPMEIVQAGFDAEATANPYKTQPHHVVPAIWQAMIDAALAENSAPASPLSPGFPQQRIVS